METKPSVSLVELVHQSTEIERILAENGGELTPELEEALSGVDIAVAAKVDGYDFIINRGLSTAEYYQGLADTYSRLAKSQKMFCERLKERLKFVMTQSNTPEIKGNRIRFKLVSRQPKVLIDDSSQIPADLMTQVTTLTPDKERIGSCLKDGIAVPGARLEPVSALMRYVTKEES